MNRFISPIGLIRCTGAAVLGSMLVVIGYAMRAGSSGDAAFETYTFFMGLGLWTAVISLSVVGVGLLLAQPSASESERNHVEPIDHWS